MKTRHTSPAPAGAGAAVDARLPDSAGFFAALGDRADAVRPRYACHGPRLWDALLRLYGTHPAFAEWAPGWLAALADAIRRRPAALAGLDAGRAPGWFGQPEMLGYSAYADRFAGDLRGVAERVPYLQELGVRYLHLLPFLRMRQGDSDGGFAVSDYGQVEPRLGTNADLEALAGRLREAGISLCADFVLNHTAEDHAWAEAARLSGRLDLGTALLDRPAAQLSVGQQQRVAAARALIGRPGLVVADEPTSALDADRQQAFIDLLLEECAAAGAALLFVSHDARLAAHFDRVLDLGALNHAASAAEVAR